MSNIHFFNVDATDDALKTRVTAALPDHRLTFHEGVTTIQPDAEVISPFVNSPVTADMMAAMPSLKLIATRSTGFDHIDLAAAAQHGITVSNVPTYGENTVAEYAFGLLLALVRKIPQAAADLRAGQTSRARLRGVDLEGKTLGILGAGRIGCRMAAIGRGFGMNVIAFDAYPNPERAAEYGFTYRAFDEVLAAADILSIHVPALPGTTHLINAKALAAMKPGAVLVNTARGEVVDTPALIQALTSGHLAGAALDVFEGEGHTGPDLQTLLGLPNVLLTNHNAFNTDEAVGRINQTTIDNITAYLAGSPQNVIKA